MRRKLMFGFCIFFFTGLGLWLASCTNKDKVAAPDVSDIQVALEIMRFEQDLFSLDTNRMEDGLQELEAQYPYFSGFFFHQILGIPAGDSLELAEEVRGFITYPAVRQLYDTCQVVYAEMESLEKEIEQGFRYFAYYFPQQEIPRVYTMISEYTAAIVLPPLGNSVVIGLDLFLGPEYKIYYYEPLNLPRYITSGLTARHIPARMFDGLLDNILPLPSGNRLLDLMIYNGKRLYMLDRLLPFTADSILLGYSGAQTEWCADNEKEIWQYFISENLLYSDDYQKIRKYVDHSPHSPGMPPEAPGRTANYIGWQIMERYMQRHPETTVQELIALDDPQLLLDKARYAPR